MATEQRYLTHNNHRKLQRPGWVSGDIMRLHRVVTRAVRAVGQRVEALDATWEKESRDGSHLWSRPDLGRVAGDLNCDHLVNHQDLTIVDAALGLPVCSASDPRDLNQDGKINALDAQLLANKCTKLGCK